MNPYAPAISSRYSRAGKPVLLVALLVSADDNELHTDVNSSRNIYWLTAVVIGRNSFGVDHYALVSAF